MKKLLLTVMICALAFGAFAQMPKIDPSQIDFAKVDLSKVKFYFQGPMELLVKGVVYDGNSYAVTLDYDGMGTMTAKLPNSTDSSSLPNDLDLSSITLMLGSDSLMVGNVVANGATFSGKLVPKTLALKSDNIVQASLTNPKMVAAPKAAMTTADAAKVATLEKQIKTLKMDLDKAKADAAGKDAEIASMKAKPAEVKVVTKVVTAETQAIKGTRAVVGANITKYVVSDGTWKISGNKLIQSDDSQLYAKCTVPVAQTAASQEYAFKVASTGKGRVGAGLHFLASDVKEDDKYGFGSSYLVWITRDPKLQTDSTFIQVYKSSSDIRMAQIASKEISSDITKMNAIRVVADRNNDMLYVFVNESLEISIPAKDLKGDKIALRTMGSAEFSF